MHVYKSGNSEEAAMGAETPPLPRGVSVAFMAATTTAQPPTLHMAGHRFGDSAHTHRTSGQA